MVLLFSLNQRNVKIFLLQILESDLLMSDELSMQNDKNLIIFFFAFFFPVRCS